MSSLTVSQLTRRIRTLLEEQVGDVWVEGEISNHRLQSSGHQYFTLKDETAQISCVLFRGAGARLSTPLRDGMQVQLYGEITVYEQRGNYQILVKSVQPKGLGTLQARFEVLKQKLAQEGLFDPDWKKPIPRFPRCVALVTSPTGAAVKDMLNILTRRAPWLRVLVFPVRVQGQGAERGIAAAIQALNQAEQYDLPVPDTIVVGRGGGSLEDLWNFNEEIVARAIFASEIPVVSAVGHEIDFTISDFVADLRAPTPSAAAELLAPDSAELQRHFTAVEKALRQKMAATLDYQTRILDLIGKGTLVREPERLLREAEQRVDDVSTSLEQGMQRMQTRLEESIQSARLVLERHHPLQRMNEAQYLTDLIEQRIQNRVQSRLTQASDKVGSLDKLLKSLGPDGVLARGFSMTTNARGEVVMNEDQVRIGETLVTHLGTGSVSSVVTGLEK